MMKASQDQLARLTELLNTREWRTQGHGFAKHAATVSRALQEGHEPKVTTKSAQQLIDWLCSVPFSPEGKRHAEQVQKQIRRAPNRQRRQLASEKASFKQVVERTEKRVCKRCGKDLTATPSVRTGLGPVCAEHFVG